MDKINQLQELVSNFSHGEIEGIEIDVQTANAILTVYNALGDSNKQKFISHPIANMAHIAWELVS